MAPHVGEKSLWRHMCRAKDSRNAPHVPRQMLYHGQMIAQPSPARLLRKLAGALPVCQMHRLASSASAIFASGAILLMSRATSPLWSPLLPAASIFCTRGWHRECSTLHRRSASAALAMRCAWPAVSLPQAISLRRCATRADSGSSSRAGAWRPARRSRCLLPPMRAASGVSLFLFAPLGAIAGASPRAPLKARCARARKLQTHHGGIWQLSVVPPTRLWFQ